MGAVTILKWEQDLKGWMKAVTKVGTWYAHEDGHWRLPDSWGATMTNGNLGGAKAICEADYIQRCTEFLSLYDPATHIKLSRECAGDVLGLLDAWADRLNAVEHKPTWGIVPDFDPSVTELRAALEGEK